MRDVHTYTSSHRQGRETGCQCAREARGTQTSPRAQRTCANIHRRAYTQSPLLVARTGAPGPTSRHGPAHRANRNGCEDGPGAHGQMNTDMRAVPAGTRVSTAPTRPLARKRTRAHQEEATITHRPTHTHTAHALLTGISFSETFPRTPFSLGGLFDPGKFRRHSETQSRLRPPTLETGNAFPCLWTDAQGVREGAVLGPITGAGWQEGAHYPVPAPGDILTRNGFELPGTGRA